MFAQENVSKWQDGSGTAPLVDASSSDARNRDAAPGGKPLRIAYVWDADYPWDVRTEKICAALSAAGHDVHLIARNKAWAAETERAREATIRRMRAWKWLGKRLDRALSFPAFFSPRWFSLIDGVVRDAKIDVIIVRDLPLCPLAIRVGRRRQVPVILDMAENYAAMMQEIWNAGRQKWFDYVVRNPRAVAKIERYCLPRLDHVITVVEESAQRVIPDCDRPECVSVVSNTPPRDRARASVPRNYHREGPLHVVYLGLMEIPRGVGVLLEAVAQLKSRGRSIRLTLIGGGRDETIFREHAARLGLDGVATFHGYVPNDKALEMVATADVGMVPHFADDSWNTTIPNKLFDYMAAGLPVVSSDAIPCARVVQQTQSGEIFRSGDAVDLAGALDRLFDGDVRRARGDSGRRAILEQHNWEESTAVLLRVVSETVDGARARGDSARR